MCISERDYEVLNRMLDEGCPPRFVERILDELEAGATLASILPFPEPSNPEQAPAPPPEAGEWAAPGRTGTG